MRHILDLYQRKAHCDENSTTLKDTLEKDINTAFKGQQKYIFELLQNADDSGNENEFIEVKFVLVSHEKNNYLIFSHTGKHFDEKDVERICSNAQQGSESKTKEAQKIGYKGIGFKAVFSIADCVYIFSNQYQFRFDKHYPKWQTGTASKGYPWPIIPIWTERDELPPALLKQIDDKAVNFIIQLKSDVDVTSDLNTILKTPEISLFLRRVKLIHIQYNHQDDIIKLINSEDNIQELYLNNKIHSRWLTHKIIFDIPPEMKETLRKMNDYECPVRLKEASQTQILFAAKLTSTNDIKRLKKSIIYCYLPTQTSLQLPFLVNADFLLNAERTQILENDWNKALANAIGVSQFWWLEGLNQNAKFRYKILKILYFPPSHDLTPRSPPIQASLDRGAKRGLSNVPILPSYQDSNRLIIVTQGHYDAVGFFDYFSEISKPDNLIDPKLENVDHVKSTLEKYLSVKVFCKEIEYYANQNKSLEFQLKLLTFLKQKPLDEEGWEYYLPNTKFILSSKNHIVCPKDLYINTKIDFLFPQEIELNFINPMLKESEIHLWLQQLGAHVLSSKAIIRNQISKMIKENQFNEKNIVPITLFIVKLFTSKKPAKKDRVLLSELPVLTTKKNLLLPGRAFLSDMYKPKFLLQKIVPQQDIFVSKTYLDLLDETLQLEDLKKFFLMIGVQEDIKFFIRHEYYSIREAREDQSHVIEKKHIFENYLKHLQKMDMAAKAIKPEHSFRNFFDSNFSSVSNTPETLTIFWKKLMLNWSLFSQENEMSYHTRAQQKSVTINFIEYFIQYTPSVPATDGRLYPATQVYAPKFLCYQQKWLPELVVANLPIELNEEQHCRFGFKTQLNSQHCIRILVGLNQSNNKDIKIYSEILLQFLQNQERPLIEEDLHLLNLNDELVPIRQLHCFAVPGRIPPPDSSSWFIKPLHGISLEQQITICKRLNLKIVDDNSLQLSHTELKEDQKIKQHLLSRIDLIARVEAASKKCDEAQLIEIFKKKIQVLNFYTANRLMLSYKNIPNFEMAAFARLDRNKKVYINKRWNNESTIGKFCQTIADYLEVSEVTQGNMRSMLTIDSFDIPAWLVENQFPTSVIEAPKLNINLNDTDSNDESTVSENHGASFFVDEPIQEGDNIPVIFIKKRKISNNNNDSPIYDQEIDLDNNNNNQSKEPSAGITDNTSFLAPFTFSTPEKSRGKIAFKSTDEYDYSQVSFYKISFNTSHSLSSPTRNITSHFQNLNQANKNSLPSTSILKSPEMIREIFPTKGVLISSNIDSYSIGRVGEEFVFKKLKQWYQEKYLLKRRDLFLWVKDNQELYYVQENQLKKNTLSNKEQEKIEGYIALLHGDHAPLPKNGYFCLFNEEQNEKSFCLDVQWVNQSGETGKPYDLLIRKNGVTRIVEVKTTIDSNKSEFTVSQHEFTVMEEYKERYRFFRVNNAGQDDAGIGKIKDPAKKIKDHELSVKSYTLKF